MRRILLFGLSLLAPAQTSFGGSTAMEFWNQYDARSEPLEAEVVKSWSDDKGNYELVRYRLGRLIGSNKSASPVIAAYYGFPESAAKHSQVPGIVHIHGGGQRAHKGRVADWVRLGYACISINWGGRVLEEADTPNTEWDGLAAGFIRPGVTKAQKLDHHNLVAPAPNTLHKEPHLLNSSWNLIAMSVRRALTFLEQRPEVDPDKLGIEGHSMGGRSTVLSAIDPRIKAASPSVGGSGFLYTDMWGLPGSARRMKPEDGLELYSQVVSAQSYWPHVNAPVLFLQGANDFNAPMDLVIKGMSLLPEDTERMVAIAPHLNHRFTTETAAARFMWMEAHLKGNFAFPRLSRSRLQLNTDDGVPHFEVMVNRSSGLPVKKVEIFYGYTRDPRIRFWRSAAVNRENETVYSAKCPVFDVGEPLFAFANITYKIPRPLPARPGAAATDYLTVSSEYQSAYPAALKAAKVKATESRQRVIDDFARGWQDWYRLNAENPHHWFYSTRKVLDPSWMGPKGAQLEVELVTTEVGNRLAVGLELNTWQGYTGRKRDTYHAFVQLDSAGEHTVSLRPADFKNAAGNPLTDWDEATELNFTPASRISNRHANWDGKPLELRNLRWVGGTLEPRPYPHELRKGTKLGVSGFSAEFQKAIDDSVALERMDEEAKGNKDGRVYLTKAMATFTESFARMNDNKAWAGGKISVGGSTYERGLGVHADSKLVFPLAGKYAEFHVVAGPDDAHRGTLEMKILVDGKEAYTSGETSSRVTAREPIRVPLTGAKTLTLVVDSLGERGGDHASWADACLIPVTQK